jgi:hypothetical protein
MRALNGKKELNQVNILALLIAMSMTKYPLFIKNIKIIAYVSNGAVGFAKMV